MHKIVKSINLISQSENFISLFWGKELIAFRFDWWTLSHLLNIKLWWLRPSVNLFYPFTFKVMNKRNLLRLKLVSTFLIGFHESKNSFIHLLSFFNKNWVDIYLWYLSWSRLSPYWLDESNLWFFLVCHLFRKLFSESGRIRGSLLGFLFKKLLLKIDV